MTEPVHDIICGLRHPPRWQNGAINHDDGQAERARAMQLGNGSFPAGIPCDDMCDAVGPEQRQVASERKRTPGDDDLARWQRRRSLWWIDEAQQVDVLGPGREGVQPLPAKAKENPALGFGKRVRCSLHVADRPPVVVGARLPGRPFQRDQRCSRLLAGRKGMAAHLGRKGMRRIDDVADLPLPDERNETLDATKAADPGRKRLSRGGRRTAGIGENCRDAAGGERQGELAGLGGAAEKKDMAHD